MEVTGVVLGSIPLIIAALEYYPKAKELGTQVWGFRRARAREMRQVEYCRAYFELHIRTLLEPLKADSLIDAAEVERYIQSPAGFSGDPVSMEDALAQRLAGQHSAYLGVLYEVQTLMGKLLKAAKVDNEAFKKHLESKSSNGPSNVGLRLRADAWLRSWNTQRKIAVHALSYYERTKLLEDLKANIGQLDTLLGLAKGISYSHRSRSAYRVPDLLKAFCRRAESIWNVVQDNWQCQCRQRHGARLWVDHKSMIHDSLDLSFLYEKYHTDVAAISPWRKQRIKVEQSGGHCACGIDPPQINGSVRIVVQDPSTNANGTASHGAYDAEAKQNVRNLLDSGLCPSLSDHVTATACLGALHCHSDNHHYHFKSSADQSLHDCIPLSAILERSSSSRLLLIARLRLATTLAAAHIRYYQTPWISGKWCLRSVFFPAQPNDPTQIQYDCPYLLTDFSGASSTPLDEQGFWTFGVLLLELCFGRALETHHAWELPSRDPAHPLQRRAIAMDWARDVQGEIGSAEYSDAVKWCLSESPTHERWREDFYTNVLGPLKAYVSTFTDPSP